MLYPKRTTFEVSGLSSMYPLLVSSSLHAFGKLSVSDIAALVGADEHLLE